MDCEGNVIAFFVFLYCYFDVARGGVSTCATSTRKSYFVWWVAVCLVKMIPPVSNIPLPPKQEPKNKSSCCCCLPFGWGIGTLFSWKSSGAGPDQPNANVDNELACQTRVGVFSKLSFECVLEIVGQDPFQNGNFPQKDSNRPPPGDSSQCRPGVSSDSSTGLAVGVGLLVGLGVRLDAGLRVGQGVG